MSDSSAARSTRARMDWVDIIKATSVILVVLLHVTQTLDFAVDDSVIVGFWNGVMTFLEPLRMPVFFVVSGILASSAVKRPWSWTKSRTVGILYLYLLWHTLLTVFALVADLLTKGYTEGMLVETFHEYFIQIFITPGGYWYFYALVLYFVLARLLRDRNPWLVLGVAASINLARPLVTDTINAVLEPLGVSNMLASVALNAVYFLAGVYLVQFFKDYAARNDSAMLVGTATVAVLGSLARLLSPEVAAGSFLPIAAAWVLTAILVAVRLQDNEKVRAFGSTIGPRTLPIFVVQFFIIDLLYLLLGTTGGAVLESSPVLQIIYPVVVTLAITAFSLWVYELALQRSWSSLLFKAPAAWTARPQAVAVDAPATGTDSADAGSPALGTDADTGSGSGSPAKPADGQAAAPTVPAVRDRRATGEVPAVQAG